MTLRTLSQLSLIVLLFLGITGTVSRSGTIASDSLDKAIAQLMERIRLKGLEGNEASLDSILILADSAQRLAALGSGKIDTVNGMADYHKAWVAMHQGSFSRAESLIGQAIKAWRSVWGDDCPQQAAAMRLLGDLYNHQCRYTECEETYRRALAILQEAPPYNGVFRSKWLIGLIYNNWAGVCVTTGRYDSASILFSQAMNAWTEDRGTVSPEIATILHNLAEMAWRKGDYVESENLIRRAISINERIPAEDRIRPVPIEEARMLLGIVWVEQGKLRDADSLFDVIVDHFRKTFGQSTLDNHNILENASFVARRCRNWAKALRYAEEVAEMDERTGQLSGAEYSRDILNLAVCYYSLHQWERSREAFEKTMLLRQSFLSGAFSYASEKTKMMYARQFPTISSGLLSLSVRGHDSSAICSALLMTLTGKAVLLDALADERSTALCSDQPELRSLVGRYAGVCDTIANLAVQSAGIGISGSSNRSLRYYQQKDSLELELSRRCAEFGNRTKDSVLRIADVAKSLPTGSVLWEFVRYDPYSDENIDSSMPAHYLAFTLDFRGHATVTELGEADTIDSLVAAVHSKVQDGSGVFLGEEERQLEEDLAKVSSQLTALILGPLLKTAVEYDHIFISPDGQLSLLPFEILPLSDSRYAIEQFEFSYLSTGRDLLKFQSESMREALGAVVLAAPDYEMEQSRTYAQAKIDFDRILLNRFRGPSDRTECLSVPFNPLPAAEKEGQLVSDLLNAKLRGKVVSLSGLNASEDSLKHLSHPPRVLHLATHGYFCSKASYSDISLMTESPLLYSGLALAGCNRTIRGSGDTAKMTEDGILTALEASGLNLMGTDLVVLGSCRAGVGPVLQGEGVYGLRRAFQLAGARSIIMSMFDVPDLTARDLMTRFYTDWLSGTTKSKALRNAMLAELTERREQHGAAHPLFWGGFILAGDYK